MKRVLSSEPRSYQVACEASSVRVPLSVHELWFG